MKKIEMGKKYTRDGRTGTVRFVDGKYPGLPVLWEDEISGALHLLNEFGQEYCDGQPLVEVSPYADIPIDTPGWARVNGVEWVPRYFAGVSEAGKPTAWVHGATSFSTDDGGRTIWDEFTTTKPEGVE